MAYSLRKVSFPHNDILGMFVGTLGHMVGCLQCARWWVRVSSSSVEIFPSELFKIFYQNFTTPPMIKVCQEWCINVHQWPPLIHCSCALAAIMISSIWPFGRSCLQIGTFFLLSVPTFKQEERSFLEIPILLHRKICSMSAHRNLISGGILGK